MYAKNIRRWVVPVLERCEQRERGAYRRLLREFLLTRSRTDLVIPLQIFQTSKTGVHVSSNIFTSQLFKEVCFSIQDDRRCRKNVINCRWVEGRDTEQYEHDLSVLLYFTSAMLAGQDHMLSVSSLWTCAQRIFSNQSLCTFFLFFFFLKH